MASKVPEYLIQIFEEAIANNNYDVDDLFEKAKVKKNQLYKETGKGTYAIPTSKEKFLVSFKKFVADKNSMSVEDYTTYIKERIADLDDVRIIRTGLSFILEPENINKRLEIIENYQRRSVMGEDTFNYIESFSY